MDLKAIEQRTRAATREPWNVDQIAECIRITRDHVPALVARVRELEEENTRLRHDLAVARGETIGSVPSWAEYAEQERLREAEAVRCRPKPRLTLGEAREMAALERARENGGGK